MTFRERMRARWERFKEGCGEFFDALSFEWDWPDFDVGDD
jgi:hypothetical protein